MNDLHNQLVEAKKILDSKPVRPDPRLVGKIHLAKLKAELQSVAKNAGKNKRRK